MAELSKLVGVLIEALQEDDMRDRNALIDRIIQLLKLPLKMNRDLEKSLVSLSSLLIFRGTSTLKCSLPPSLLEYLRPLFIELANLNFLPFFQRNAICELLFFHKEISGCLLDPNGSFGKTYSTLFSVFSICR